MNEATDNVAVEQQRQSEKKLPVGRELGLTKRDSRTKGDHCNDDDRREQHDRTHTIR
jgi:hypothetical protein